jgi:hypothetical protein
MGIVLGMGLESRLRVVREARLRLERFESNAMVARERLEVIVLAPGDLSGYLLWEGGAAHDVE